MGTRCVVTLEEIWVRITEFLRNECRCDGPHVIDLERNVCVACGRSLGNVDVVKESSTVPTL